MQFENTTNRRECVKNSHTTGFSRVVLEVLPNTESDVFRRDTTDFSRVEFQLLPSLLRWRSKLKLHTEVGGIYDHFRQL
jgi:hypothetical protein